MCSECYQTPCDFRCPNHIQPPCDCKCVQCGEGQHEDDVIQLINGDYLCNDCQRDYFTQNCGEYIDSYIEKNKVEYYLNWFFANLDEVDKLELIIDAYAKRLALDMLISGVSLLPDDRKEFCLESDDFLDYVKGEWI